MRVGAGFRLSRSWAAGRQTVTARLRRTQFVSVLLAVALVFGVFLSLATTSTSATQRPSSTGTGSIHLTAAKVPSANDIGITPTQIHIAMIADVEPSFQPGLFAKSVKVVQGWASEVNQHGGLAGRKLVVDVCDSQGNPNITANCIIHACSSDFAMVGTESVFVTDVSDFADCKNTAGQAIGIPNIAGIALSRAEQCSPDVFTTANDPTLCATANDPAQTFTVPVGDFAYYLSHFKNLHGIYIYSGNSGAVGPVTVAEFTVAIKRGLKNDGSSIYTSLIEAPQAAETPYVDIIKQKGSTFAYDGASADDSIKLVKEAVLQGVNTVKVWGCNSGCYTTSFTQQAGAAGDHTYTMLPYLPFYTDYKSNKALTGLVKAIGGVQNMDGNSMGSFTAALLFQDAVQKVVASGVTLDRQSLINVLKKKETAFNADGVIGTANVSARQPSPCIVMVEVINQKWQRVFPKAPGSFDCSKANITKVTLTPAQQ